MGRMPSMGALDQFPDNLPRQLTSFIGRERELQDLKALLERSRLLTLTGPGGSGKTRLGLQLAAEVAGGFPDGVSFVALAPVGNPDLVLSSIAQGIGLRDVGDRPLLDRLRSHLENARVLLLLDNFEHLIAAAPVVAHILQATVALRIVVTSRAPLHVSGEQEFEVPPLRVPDPQCATVAAVAGCESVRLFTERARAAWPGFVLDEENAALIARITRRLDGLPLAVELAAARVKLLPPASLLARLEHALPLLVGGPRDLPQRQQTLRGTIAWSYGLLGAGAGRLLAACSVFRGGISLEGAESVCAAAIDLGIEVLDGLQEFVDQSLLRRIGGFAGPGGPRFGMLFMVREYAAERLAEMPERARVGGGPRRYVPGPGRSGRARAARPRRAGVAGPARGRAPEHPRRHRLVHPARALRGAAAGRGDVPLLGRPRPLHRRAPAAEGAARRVRGRNRHSGEGAERRGIARHRPGRPRRCP